jgi:methylenetetrahydrofolate reductase (NADPH)
VKLIERWRSTSRPTISFEVFPARTPKAAVAQAQAVGELVELAPDFVSVTFGAGGSTRVGSAQLVEQLRGLRLETLAYFACYGLSPATIHEVLARYRELGVENVLAVRGDEPSEPGFVAHPESLSHASDLLTILRERYPFCRGAAAYPEGHREAGSREQDLEYLALKIRCGAEFVITQYCYDDRVFADFVARCRAHGITVPIIAGVMPIFSVKMMESLGQVCGATITDEIRRGLAALPENDADAVLAFGIELATRQCRALLRAGVAGLHFYTLNRSRSVAPIVQQLRTEGLV